MQLSHGGSIVLRLQYKSKCSCSEVLCLWTSKRVTDLFRTITSWQISEARNKGTDSKCVGCSCTQGRCDIVTAPGQARTRAYELRTWCGQIVCWRAGSISIICKCLCFLKKGLEYLFIYVWTLHMYLCIRWWSFSWYLLKILVAAPKNMDVSLFVTSFH